MPVTGTNWGWERRREIMQWLRLFLPGCADAEICGCGGDTPDLIPASGGLR